MRGCLVFNSSHISVVQINGKQQEALTPCKIYSMANSHTSVFFWPMRVHFALLQAFRHLSYLFKQIGIQSMEENNCAEVAQACILEMLFHFALGCYAYSKIVFKCFL